MIRLWIHWLQTLQGEILPALFYSIACRAPGIWDLARRWETLGAATGQGKVLAQVGVQGPLYQLTKRSQLSFSEPDLGLPAPFPS